jgi:glycosyltransferase involved in cell wall biosynthesis
MNVLHISAGNLFGGVETLLATLARHRDLCPEMVPHFALCFEGRLASDLRAAGVLVHLLGEVRVRKPWTVLRARRVLARLLQRQRFDVAVCHSVWPQALFGPVIQSAGLPLVFWLHDAARGTHWLERWAKWTRPDGVLCNSRFTAQGLPNLYRDAGAKVIYYPVTGRTLPFSADERRSVRAELMTPKDATVIIQVSRLEPYKGYLLHLEAMGRLLDLKGWACWLVGGAQRKQEFRFLGQLKRRCASLGISERIHFLGQRSDVARLLTAADIHCQPNKGPEPFGITFIEGLLAGLPVITTAIGGAVEIVDPSTGILVPPADPDALAASLRRLILESELRSRLGAAGPGRAHRLCDPRQQMYRLYEFFHRALERNRAA